MHKDEGSAVFCGDAGDARIVVQTGDVVDDFRSSFQGGFGDLRLSRVNGNGDFDAAAEALENRQNASQLFLRGDAAGTGAGRFAANVEEIGAIEFHRESMLDGDVCGVILAAV